MPQSLRDAWRHFIAADQRGEILRDADEAGDTAFLIAHGDLARQAPHGHMRLTPKHLQALDDWLSGAQHLRVLLRRDAAKIARADLAGPFAEHLRFAREAMPLDERLIHDHIPSVGVFDEKSRVMHQIGHLLDKLRVDQKVPAGREDAGKR